MKYFDLGKLTPLLANPLFALAVQTDLGHHGGKTGCVSTEYLFSGGLPQPPLSGVILKTI